jgi:hypothetical protein
VQIEQKREDETRHWTSFALWPAQRHALAALDTHRRLVLLKARQLGLSWLVLGYALWQMLFRPIATVLLWSKTDREAMELVGYRLAGMYERLPRHLKSGGKATKHGIDLGNGSRAMAFPTTGGRSYTATVAIVDEADFVPDLNKLLDAAQPTVDAGGKLILVSTVDKEKPTSAFKKLYRDADHGENGFAPIFLPWQAHPERTQAWYDETKRTMISRASIDKLHQEYPATSDEALAASTQLARLPQGWLVRCWDELDPLAEESCVRPYYGHGERGPAIPGLRVYQVPALGHHYLVGADTAEGNPTSDNSAFEVLDEATGEEVASFAGKVEPAVYGGYLHKVGTWYNSARLMVERNNHGHAVLLWLRDNSPLELMNGHDGNTGWLTSTKGKILLYDACAELVRNAEVQLHDHDTYSELATVEGATLKAPEPLPDDRATAFALACAATLKRERDDRFSRTDLAPFVVAPPRQGPELLPRPREEPDAMTPQVWRGC